MEKRKIKRIASILALVVATACISVFLPSRAVFEYSYEIGDKWRHETLYADFSFPIYKTDEQIQTDLSKLSSEFIPYYKLSPDAETEVLKKLETLDLPADSKSRISFILSEAYRKGVLDNNIKSDNDGSEPKYIYLQKDKRASKYLVDELYRVSQVRLKLAELNYASVKSASEAVDLVVPNLIYDEHLSSVMKADDSKSISYTDGYVDAGKVIVKKGEIITPELFQVIDSYRKEYNASSAVGSTKWISILVFSLFVLLILVILYLVIWMVSPHIIGTNAYYYILAIFVIFNIAVVILTSNVDELYLLLFPFTLIALLLQAFFSPKLVIPVYLICLMPVFFMIYNGYGFFILFAIAGIVSIFLFPYFNKGWRQFLLALIIFLIMASITALSYLLNPQNSYGLVRRIFMLSIGSLLTVAGYPLVYLFERIFNLVSNSRLVEISDTSSPLLRQLEAKAPGTLQHSLQVMNMADFAARAIDANPLLVRAGALYHDIGKMKNPLCFVENESLLASESDNRYHSGLTPTQSAQEIIKHVQDGVELAKDNRLPDVVIDFIRSHHGTGCVQYFYTKYLNDGGSDEDMPKFCYDGIKPRTKEQVILMLCDTIEAASRTIKDHTPESYAQFIHSLISGKLHQGQLDDSDISVRELGILEETLKTYLAQMRHERIDYPKRKR